MNDYDNHRCRPDHDSIASIALRKIFIGGLSYGTDDEKLRKYFGVYGTVQDAVVMKDPVSRRSRGFGFITFTDIHAVDNALAHEPHTIDARKVEAKRAVPRSEVSRDSSAAKPNGSIPNSPSIRPMGTLGWSTGSLISSPSLSTMNMNLTQSQIMSESRQASDPRISMDEYAYNKIFVGGLHYDTRDAEFRAYFERFGRIMSAEVMFNRETHKSRGFGFIVFELERGAEQVCAEREHVIDGKVVEVKRAIPRSRILPDGTILSPTSNPLMKPINQPGLIRSLDIPKGYLNIEQSMGIANSKLRHDVRRSASVGDPAMMMGHMLGKPIIANKPGLAASIAAIGVPSPRSRQKTTASDMAQFSSNSGISSPISRGGMGGATYATALRVGASTDDSETSITDQMMIAGLKSDLYAFGGGGGGSGDHSYLFRMHDTIERPLRSYSEPVIQLPESMIGMDYFRNQINEGMGVSALGGAFNPQSPLQSIYENSSPTRLQKPIRSPVLSSQPPSSVLSPLGLSWLNSSLSNTTDAMHLQGAGDLFPPLSLPVSSNMVGDSLSIKREYQQSQYEHHKQDFFQSQIGAGSRHSEQIDEIGIPTPSAWASMLMSLPSTSTSPQVSRQQGQDSGQDAIHKSSMQMQMQQQSSEVNQQGVALGFYSLHDQQSQELNYPYSYQVQQEESSVQQQVAQQQVYYQMQPPLPNSYDKNLQGDSNNHHNFCPSQSQWNAYSPASGLGTVRSGSIAGSGLGSGAASRSGSLLESVGHVSLTSGTTDKDELFLYEDMRLDGDAPDFEPQTLPAAYRAW